MAALVGVDPSTIRRWRTARPAQGPPFVRLSSRVTEYVPADVRVWMRRHRTGGTASRTRRATGAAARSRLAACSNFAAAVTDLRRGVIAVWFRRGWKDQVVADEGHAVVDYRAAHAEADRLGAVALGAKFRMLLLLDDPGLRELADDAFRQVDAILSAADKAMKAVDAGRWPATGVGADTGRQGCCAPMLYRTSPYHRETTRRQSEIRSRHTGTRNVALAAAGRATFNLGMRQVSRSLTIHTGFCSLRETPMKIAILGTGKVAHALGAGWKKSGHDVIFGARDASATDPGFEITGLQDALAAGDVIVNAIVGAVALQAITALDTSAMAGKTLLDATNARTGTGDLVYPNSSLGEHLQAALPAVHVVKSLNTAAIEVLADPSWWDRRRCSSPATTRRPRPRLRGCSTTWAGRTRGSSTSVASRPPADRRATPCCSSRSSPF